MSRCQHYRDLYSDIDSRCTATATHYLRDHNGKRIGIWCEEHAREIVDEYREKLDWNWTMELIPEEEL